MDKFYNENNKTTYLSRTKRYIDEYGNEGVETEIYKKVYGTQQFWKIILSDLLSALGLISNSKQLDIYLYVFQNVDPSNNLFIGTIRKTVEATNISYKTVADAFKNLQKVDIMVKEQNGVYRINPKYAIKGNEYKRQRLVIQYEKSKNEIKGQTNIFENVLETVNQPVEE